MYFSKVLTFNFYKRTGYSVGIRQRVNLTDLPGTAGLTVIL